MPELIVILVVALIVLGPKRLPEVARQVGKALGELRRQSSEIVEEFQTQALLEDEAARRKTPAPSAQTSKSTPAKPADPA